MSISTGSTAPTDSNAATGSHASTERNRDLALHFAREGWGTQPEWERVWDKLVAVDVIHHFNSASEAIVGLEANKVFNASLFTGFPDIQQQLAEIVVEGDTAVYRATLQGTHTGQFLDIPATGRTVKINGFTMLKFVDDKIVEWWYECNLLEMLKQLGLLPEST